LPLSVVLSKILLGPRTRAFVLCGRDGTRRVGAAKLLAGGKLPSMKDLLGAFRDQENGYPAAGSFCGYLIETYGIEKFRELYPSTDPSAAAQSLLGKDFEAIDADWRGFLSQRKK
jgi:hypothetical protein